MCHHNSKENNWNESVEEEEEREFSRTEICAALEKQKMGKSPGTDGVCGEMLEHGGETVAKWI